MKGVLPSPTPAGQLIRRERNLAIPKLTIRAAAARIGMSAEQWGYIERGHLPSRGGQPPEPFAAPAATLAKMAHALKITPERLESEGQRPDAAEILREIPRQDGSSTLPTASAPGSRLKRNDADDAELAPYIRWVHEDLGRAMARYGPSFTGEQAFSLAHEAEMWDDPDNEIPDDDTRVRWIARMRRLAAAWDAERRQSEKLA